MTHRNLLLCFGILVVSGSCVETTTEPIARAPRGGAGDPCSQEWRCGANSPVIDTDKGFHDLNLDGLPNDAGMRLHSPALMWNEQGFDLAIEDGRIVGRTEGRTALARDALRGAEIWIDTDTASPAYKISIEQVHTIPFPFPYGSTDELEVYVFGWRAASDPTSVGNLCRNPPRHLSGGSHDTRAYAELLGMDPDDALVFAGDRIYDATKTMSKDPDPGWFNIGCAGHTVAKLHLTRNTLASETASVPAASHAKRQATLKLLVADYCGTGRSFTVPGQPLEWKGQPGDARDSYFTTPATLEARWNRNGATCVSVPRMVVSTLKSAREYYPSAADVWEEIRSECDLPSCGESLDWGHLIAGDEFEVRISANPYPEATAPPPPPPPPVTPPTGSGFNVGVRLRFNSSVFLFR